MIKVFNATDKNYATHGDLILQPSKAVVHKEDNGEFYLDLETPLNEKEYKNTTPEQGQTVEGTSFSIEVDKTKQEELLSIKGQTSQDGTPTPSTPQPINITTGRQVVRVCGKNRLKTSLEIMKAKNTAGTWNNNVYTYRQVDFTVNDDLSITINGTATGGRADFFLFGGTTDTGDYIYIPQGTYSVYKTGLSDGTIFLSWREKTAGVKYTTQSNNSAIETMANQDCYFYAVMLGLENNKSMNNYTFYPMLVSGSTLGEYQSYTVATYPINLGKNLFDKDNASQILNAYINTTGYVLTSIATMKTAYINCQPNTTYTISKIRSARFAVASYTSITFGTGSTNGLSNPGADSLTITTGANDKYLAVFYYHTSDTLSEETIRSSIMIEKGSVATTYAPYKTPIYLGKIGNYQDYIFKNTTENPLYDSNLEEGQWYIHKEIGKYTFTGTENWQYTSATKRFSNVFSNINLITPTDTGRHIEYIKSNYFYNSTSDVDGGMFQYQNQIIVHNYNYTSASDFKTWLSSHNVEVYYVLATPTNTLIEDEELINQLESIQLISGLNNVIVSSPYLPAILQLKYNFTTAYSNVIKYIDYLVPNNILVANTPQGDQAFRITNIEKTRRKIRLRANHVFYDSMNYLIADSYVVDKDCNAALDHLNNATDTLSPFTTISNITSINSYRCVRKSLYEAIQVVLERWGGHLVRNDWTIGINDEIGQDNGVTIRYGKNLKNISATYDWNEVVTKLLPVGKDGILLNEIDPDASIYVESATQYDIPYTKTVSFEQNDIVEDNYKDEEGTLDEDTYKQALVDDLHSQAMEYITNNYLPKVNYKLSANVEKVSDVGDRVEVIDEKLGINLMTNIISYDYDCILERYTQIEFGNFVPTLSNLMTQISTNTEEQININNQTLQITLNQELTTATDKIWDALGNSYVIYEGDKILVVDTLPKEAATNVIMINNGGIAFSNNGINGTFSSAWTIDNVLNMENINVINLSANLVKGGTLKLGSNLNQNGQLEVYDETNALIAEFNKDGLKMYGADGSYVLMNNDVGFAGYDKNDNKIYWVDKDEFHMKKSVIEEEITLCNKMRYIPITIRDNNNNIINDGIGLVSVMGGE